MVFTVMGRLLDRRQPRRGSPAPDIISTRLRGPSSDAQRAAHRNGKTLIAKIRATALGPTYGKKINLDCGRRKSQIATFGLLCLY
jgi:hypothetical protein